MIIKFALGIALIFGALSPAIAQTRDYTRHVNPFIGTGGHGHTFPGATMPFGMVQLSPDTRIDNWDGSSGYHYSDDIIYGFSHTHLSGTGIPDGCDILFMPTVKEGLFFPLLSVQEWYVSKFSHQNESAEPGYYSVKLDNGITAELTSTPRVGFHRYTYPKAGPGNVVLDLKWRDKRLDSSITSMSKNRIEGFRRSSSWAKNHTVYFVVEFSKAFESAYAQGGHFDPPPGSTERPRWHTENYQRIIKFKVGEGEKILLRVAISYVSIEGARKNLEAELPHWDFDKVRAEAKVAWNKELSKIEVSGGTPEQTTNFYTALYHTMIHPNVFNDVDGRYRGHDGKIHQLGRNADAIVRNEGVARTTTSAGGTGDGGRGRPRSGDHYTVFSLWDTFRAAHPLYTIIDQKRTVDYINSFIRIYEQGGRLPVWELWGEETDTMIGYHAVSVIADAMAKGIKGFDYEKAYAAAKHSAELDHFGLAGYKKRGYISMEDENESVSRTLEYAYNDWCISQMASTLYTRRAESINYTYRSDGVITDSILKKLSDEHDKYALRAGYYENLFDTKTGFFRAKKNGGFVEPFSPTEVNFGFTEGNSWQYSFFVPHDLRRLIELHGGREKSAAKLDEMFTTDQKLSGREQADLTGLIGQYAHGNEPSHHIAYLYNYVGQAWKTQKYVRQIMDEFYKNAPDGLIGNEDCGQMSAWYILSASGFYPVAPGDAIYVLGTPLFPEVKYKLENGKVFTIKASNVSSENFYIQSATLKGRQLDAPILSHDEVMKGGSLEFVMTDKPQTTAFPSKSGPITTLPGNAVAVPLITGPRTFSGNTTVSLSTTKSDSKIRFTKDGSDPTLKSQLYVGPITIDNQTTIKAITEDFLGRMSLVAEAIFTKRPNDWTVRVLSGYSTQYTGGGENAIVDGIRGTTNFASGEWQGIQGKPYEAVIDLKRETEIRELGASFLQVAGPWIWMPANFKFEISDNGTDWKVAADVKTDIPLTEMKPTIKEFTQKITPVKARYVRIRAFNIGKIPSWHLGAGGDPWIFIDEIFIR
ncbi:MAG: GH92 family glycosyl hydrolase [Chloracidobacterium sp.]|nr:GH92 family glycosyl hydrolase [Chloracidobacterium sp.]